jgi:hypothetical protein
MIPKKKLWYAEQGKRPRSIGTPKPVNGAFRAYWQEQGWYEMRPKVKRKNQKKFKNSKTRTP